MTTDPELLAALHALPLPVCIQLTPYRLLHASADGVFEVEFEALPAFGNHFGNVQGGFAVALLDSVISGAVYARTRVWAPTIELKTSFLEPLPIASCRGRGEVLKAGKRLAFVEGRLFGPDGRPALIATASVLLSAGVGG